MDKKIIKMTRYYTLWQTNENKYIVKCRNLGLFGGGTTHCKLGTLTEQNTLEDVYKSYPELKVKMDVKWLMLFGVVVMIAGVIALIVIMVDFMTYSPKY